MKKAFTFLLIFIFSFSLLNAQNPGEKYDSVLAQKLHADDYGMKNYILVLLKTGGNTSVTKVAEDSIFHGHLNNIGRLARNGDLVLAGPFGTNDNNYLGLFVLNVSTFEEAKKLLNTDPAIQAKLLEPEMYLWYGSASLQEILPIHDKIQKLKF